MSEQYDSTDDIGQQWDVLRKCQQAAHDRWRACLDARDYDGCHEAQVEITRTQDEALKLARFQK